MGCDYIEHADGILLHQPHLLKKIEATFGELIKDLKNFSTPSAPGYVSELPKENTEMLTSEKQKLYQKGIGMSIYLIKHSRPDVANCTRDLSKCNKSATQVHMTGLLRLLKFILDTRNAKLKIFPNNKDEKVWEIKGITDASFASNKETRRSVTGYLIFLNGVLIAWKSKTQHHVTISTTKSEYVALSHVSMEILFVRDILLFLGIEVELPIMVKVDNQGAIFLSNNRTLGQRTKHVDTRYHFVREYVEEGILKIIYVKSEDNTADMMTKNLSKELFNKHAKSFMLYD